MVGQHQSKELLGPGTHDPGLAARPGLSNLVAGIQIAMTQPVRVEDQVVVEGETGRLDRNDHQHLVVVRLWDLQRMVVH